MNFLKGEIQEMDIFLTWAEENRGEIKKRILLIFSLIILSYEYQYFLPVLDQNKIVEKSVVVVKRCLC